MAQVETAKVDLFVFMGGNNGNNSLFVRPEIKSYDDIRGKTVVSTRRTLPSPCCSTKCFRRKG